MPSYIVNTAIWRDLWPVPLTAVVVAVILWLLGKPTATKAQGFWALLAFATLGVVTGLLAGFSRQPVIGAILPAVLSLVGGLAIYLLGQTQQSSMLVSLSVVALASNLLVGAFWGAELRVNAEAYRRSATYLKLQALEEKEVREFRKALGLPEIPEPLTTAVGQPQP